MPIVRHLTNKKKPKMELNPGIQNGRQNQVILNFNTQHVKEGVGASSLRHESLPPRLLYIML